MKRGFIYNFVCAAICLFIRRPTITGLEKLVPGRASLIAANHEGAWGPVVTRAWFPVPTAPWVNAEITLRGNCRKFLSGFLFIGQLHLPRWLAQPLAFIIEPLLLHLLHAGNAIPVYFEGAKVAITFKMSMERLKSGRHIMVFPDDDSSLQTTKVPDFHNGYLATVKLYQQLTGKKLLLYPMCLSSKKNLIMLGDPLENNTGSDFKAECLRINGELLKFIREMH